MSAGRKNNSRNQHWGTPGKYVDAVKKFFGGAIALDPCSNRHSIVRALVEYCLPRRNGLQESWNYPSIFVNPPYGNDPKQGSSIKNWLARCDKAHREHQTEVIALVPVATNTGHWKQHVFGKATAICFLYDTRLRFLVAGKDGGKGAPMSCACVYWGRNYAGFFENFIAHGAVVNIESLQSAQIGPFLQESRPRMLTSPRRCGP